MPELPEVETVRRGIWAAAGGQVVTRVVVRRATLRRPLPDGFAARLAGGRLTAAGRRGKYLLLTVGTEVCIVHLGMSGAFCVSDAPPAGKHDHVAFALADGRFLVYSDPRRFGLMALAPAEGALAHPLLVGMGVEPLSRAFGGAALARGVAGRRVAIKTALLEGRVVAGVGNIYASEALFAARVHPLAVAGTLSAADCARVAREVKAVLRRAIAAGGSSMRDFVGADGARGYFQMAWAVYGREGQACVRGCGGRVARVRQGGRSSFFCPRCQGVGG